MPIVGNATVLDSVVKRIWDKDQPSGGYRVFLSHKANQPDKEYAANLKKLLSGYGISCFVAHEDIDVSEQWEKEILQALRSMQAFVAIVTEEFNESPWTNQEIGFALARGVPVTSIKLGADDPKGFIGGLQAYELQTNKHDNVAFEIARIFMKKDSGMFDAYIEALNNLSGYFKEANKLAELLPAIDNLTEDQVDKLMIRVLLIQALALMAKRHDTMERDWLTI